MKAGVNIGFELFGGWKYYGKYSITAFKIAPFIFEWYGKRLDAFLFDDASEGGPFHFGIAGHYNIILGMLSSMHDMQAKSCGTSVMDNLVGSGTKNWVPQCKYQGNNW